MGLGLGAQLAGRWWTTFNLEHKDGQMIDH